MEEQSEMYRSLKEGWRDGPRTVLNAIRFFHQRSQEVERKKELAEQKAERAENKNWREKMRSPGEKDYDFMLEAGKDISYHTLDPNTDLDKLKGYLNGEHLQYCFRTSTLDGSQEMVYFTRDRQKVQRALEKSIRDTLNHEEVLSPEAQFQAEWQKEAVASRRRLGFTPQREHPIYQNHEVTERLTMEGYGLPAKPPPDFLIQSMPLDSQVSLTKLKSFMESYDLTVAFEPTKNGGTILYFVMKTDQLAKQQAALKAAFLDIEAHPEKIRKVAPTMKEEMAKAKQKSEQLLKEAKEKGIGQTKALGQDIGRGLSR